MHGTVNIKFKMLFSLQQATEHLLGELYNQLHSDSLLSRECTPYCLYSTRWFISVIFKRNFEKCLSKYGADFCDVNPCSFAEILKPESSDFSERLVPFYQTTRHYNSENRMAPSTGCTNLLSLNIY